jgi:hypothetical protein
VLRIGKSYSFSFESLYYKTVLQNASIQGGIKMKTFKKSLFALMSALLLLGAATACSNTSSKTNDPNTEQTDDGSQTGNDSQSNNGDSGK